MELQRICTDKQDLVLAFAESRIGGRQENQDSFGWKETKLGYLVTVCDGMGGGPGGKTASQVAVRTIIESISEANEEEEPSNIVKKAIMKANLAIIEEANGKPSFKGMGSTTTVLLISEKSALVAHVGDSRVYQLRGHKKVFRTFDHSMVFEMVSQGLITEEQARLSAQSNVITRALGVQANVEVDITELPYEKGDRFILCTDGIHGTMPELELLKILSSKQRNLGAITDDVATSIDNRGRSSGGGHDNLTLAIIETKQESKLKSKMSKQQKIILTVILVLLIVSMAFNFIQLTNSTSESGKSQSESISLIKDSLWEQSNEIENIKKQMDRISEFAHKAKSKQDSTNIYVDSICKLTTSNPKK